MLVFYLCLLENDADRDKFTRMYSKYAKLMKYVALQKLDDEQLAEDAVHNAFMNIIKSFYVIEDVNSHKTKRLLVVITENAAIDILRKNKNYPKISYEDLEPILSVEQDMLDNITVRELVEMIAELPEIYRGVLELRAYHGMSEKQIAAVLDIGYDAVRKRLERARAMLAERIQRQQEGERYEYL